MRPLNNLPTLSSAAFALVLLPLSLTAAETSPEGAPLNLGFELGLNWHFPSQKPMRDGQGMFLAFDVIMPGKYSLGYRFENAELSSRADEDSTGIGDDVFYRVRFHEIRVQKPVIDDLLRVGISFGTAQVHATLPINAEDGPTGTMFDTVTPTGDIFLAASAITGGSKAHAALNFVVGYRFLRIAAADPDQAGTDYQNDLTNLSGAHVGISLSATF